LQRAEGFREGEQVHKLMLLFRRPEDVDEFEQRWSHEFVPRAERMPGIRRVTVSRIYGGPAGPADLHLVHEIFFDDADALQRALVSPEGVEAGRTLINIAGSFVNLCFAEHLEEDRPGPTEPDAG
jgi:uncharacterized protein (TIGR02118 family)